MTGNIYVRADDVGSISFITLRRYSRRFVLISEAFMSQSSFNPRLPFPALGGAAHLHFNVNALVALESLYGDDYLPSIDAALRQRKIKVIRECLTIGLKDITGTPEDAFDAMPVSDIARAIGDALGLALFGRKLSETE